MVHFLKVSDFSNWQIIMCHLADGFSIFSALHIGYLGRSRTPNVNDTHALALRLVIFITTVSAPIL
jgi:hypothetical protein